MIFLILLLLTAGAQEGDANGQVCSSTECEETGKRIAEYMDKTPNYCENFYQSACGGFLKDNKFLPSDERIYLQDKLEGDIVKKVQDILEENPGPEGTLYTLVKNLYELCKENDKNYNEVITTVRNKLREVGDWPLFNEKWAGESWNFEDVEVKLRNKGFQYGSLVKFKVVLDETIPQRHIIQILPGDHWIDLKYLQSKNKNYVDYKQNMVKAMKLLRESGDETAANNYAESTLEFHTKLVELINQDNDGDLQGKLFTLESLSSAVPQVDWMKLLKGLMEGITEPKEENEIYIKDLEYLRGLGTLLNDHRKEAANVILWQAVRRLVKIHGLPSKNPENGITQEHANEEDDDQGDDDDGGDGGQLAEEGSVNPINDMDTIENYCSFETYQKLTLAVSYFYVKKHFPKTTREEAKKVVDHIKEEFLNYINEVKWMKDDTNPTTRELAKQKVNSMKIIVGYHDELEDVKNVEHVYEGLQINRDNYALANMAWNKWFTDLMFKRLSKDVAETKFWDSNSIWTKQLYNQYDNTLTIPAGYIQQPYFSPNVPKYVNYAIFGRIIGQEITKAIINEGEHYDPSAHWFGQTWWSPETKIEQEKIEICFQEVYRGYIHRTGESIDSVGTSSNNMADLGAVKLAYNTYKKNFPNEEEKLPHVPTLTTNQMFWLAGAHVWCTKLDDRDIMVLMEEHKVAPPEIQINAAYGMMSHFHDDFACQAKTQEESSEPAQKNPLYPERQCELW